MSLFDFFKKKPSSTPASAKATVGKKAKEGEKKEKKKPAGEKKVVEDKEKEKIETVPRPKKGKETSQLSPVRGKGVSGKKEGKKTSNGVYQILKSPHISEKATDLAEKGKYVFKVFPEANKTEIKKAIKSLYGVDVLSVNIIKIPPKKRRLGKISGFKKGYKKAIIKIKKGQKIEIL